MIYMGTDYMIDNFGKNNGLTLDTILHPGDSSILEFTKPEITAETMTHKKHADTTQAFIIKLCENNHNFADGTSTILVTFDKNLGKACDFFNTNCIVIEITKKQGVTL